MTLAPTEPRSLLAALAPGGIGLAAVLGLGLLFLSPRGLVALAEKLRAAGQACDQPLARSLFSEAGWARSGEELFERLCKGPGTASVFGQGLLARKLDFVLLELPPPRRAVPQPMDRERRYLCFVPTVAGSWRIDKVERERPLPIIHTAPVPRSDPKAYP